MASPLVLEINEVLVILLHMSGWRSNRQENRWIGELLCLELHTLKYIWASQTFDCGVSEFP